MGQRSLTSWRWSGVVALLGVLVLVAAPVHAEPEAEPEVTWRDVYDPSQFLSLHVELSDSDYQTIRYDETFDIYVPAKFWVEGEAESFNVEIRRKSATPINDKVSYRMKIRGQVGNSSVKTWHDLKTLSLENGDDHDVVKEGLAWFLHRTATTADYQPGLAAWVELTLHVIVTDVDGSSSVDVRPQGVYLNVEMVDKQFLKNRGLWVSDQSWLYKQDDIGLPELKDWPLDDQLPESPSRAYTALGYSPFQAGVKVRKQVVNPAPEDAELAADLEQWINMESMLRLGAVNAYSSNPDELFNHGKNFYWADFETGSDDDRRLYFPWDLDSAIKDSSSGIYAKVQPDRRKSTVSQHPYQSVILNHPTYREEFNSIMLELLGPEVGGPEGGGPMSVAVLQEFLEGAETLLTPALLADPNAKIGSTPEEVAGYFEALRAWVEARDHSVRAQLLANNQPPPRKPQD